MSLENAQDTRCSVWHTIKAIITLQCTRNVHHLTMYKMRNRPVTEMGLPAHEVETIPTMAITVRSQLMPYQVTTEA